jgi:hypothetical protein
VLASSALAFAGAFAPSPAQANLFGFGIDDRQRILQVNLSNISTPATSILFDAAPIVCAGLTGTDNTACTTGVNAGSSLAIDFFSNSFAYDKARNQFFFLDYKGNLRFWDFQPSTPVPVLAGQAINGLANSNPFTRFSANASYHENAYWYFLGSATPANGLPAIPANFQTSIDRNKLVKFAINYDGNGVPDFVNPGTATIYSIANIPDAIAPTLDPANDPVKFRFGDIAIDENDILYGATDRGGFFKVDLDTCNDISNTCSNAFDIVANGATPSGGSAANPSLQIFYDQGALYGQEFNGALPGDWGNLNLSTGTYTRQSIGSTATSLRDIAGASERSNVGVPGPLPLLGAGAALGWSRRLRHRRNLPQTARRSR